jgi:hypothetical protein
MASIGHFSLLYAVGMVCYVSALEVGVLKPACRAFHSPVSARERQISRLQDYAQFGAFPLNVDYDYTTPIFVDFRGVPCAVGYLMYCDGYEDAVAAIATESVTVHVLDVSSGTMVAWLAGSGVSQLEAAAIQPSYGDMTEWKLQHCADTVARHAEAKANSLTALNLHIDQERTRLRGHFDKIIAQLKLDSVLHTQLREIVSTDATNLLNITQRVTSTLTSMVIEGPETAAFVADHICTFAPVLPVLTNAEMYMEHACQPSGGGQWVWRRTEPLYGPPWVRSSAAVPIVEALLKQVRRITTRYAHIIPNMAIALAFDCRLLQTCGVKWHYNYRCV